MSGHVTDGPARQTAASPVVVIVDQLGGDVQRHISRYALQHGCAVLRRQLVQYCRVTYTRQLSPSSLTANSLPLTKYAQYLDTKNLRHASLPPNPHPADAPASSAKVLALIQSGTHRRTTVDFLKCFSRFRRTLDLNRLSVLRPMANVNSLHTCA